MSRRAAPLHSAFIYDSSPQVNDTQGGFTFKVGFYVKDTVCGIRINFNGGTLLLVNSSGVEHVDRQGFGNLRGAASVLISVGNFGFATVFAVPFHKGVRTFASDNARRFRFNAPCVEDIFNFFSRVLALSD